MHFSQNLSINLPKRKVASVFDLTGINLNLLSEIETILLKHYSITLSHGFME
uniref:Uncharacterized protein n=1 Tax=Rhizophora mucronata TaxID=61149 RepID=A0A2P2QID8_RHIMU